MVENGKFLVNIRFENEVYSCHFYMFSCFIPCGSILIREIAARTGGNRHINFVYQVNFQLLRGNVVASVYPLLTDETCWFLANDFDDEGYEKYA